MAHGASNGPSPEGSGTPPSPGQGRAHPTTKLKQGRDCAYTGVGTLPFPFVCYPLPTRDFQGSRLSRNDYGRGLLERGDRSNRSEGCNNSTAEDSKMTKGGKHRRDSRAKGKSEKRQGAMVPSYPMDEAYKGEHKCIGQGDLSADFWETSTRALNA
ncbi:hypothetical protein B296_00029148 [Ensete ventricosum]|uniref:Uncharacterized protein n=1 Tax=Ensete ventricosum TaxID=4639 RepID=A0A426ZNQ3_ENSVE|nr:hypothetical protein B296_00029148 [Ensete ventricosum]